MTNHPAITNQITITKHQITITKQAPITKFQSPNRLDIGTLGIGYCLVFVIWLLVIAGLASADVGPREMQRDRMAAIEWDRDPFARSPAARPAAALTLSGILWDAQAPIAIVNGQMLRAGEEVDGFRVVEIRQDHVIITDGTQTLQLSTAP